MTPLRTFVVSQLSFFLSSISTLRLPVDTGFEDDSKRRIYYLNITQENEIFLEDVDFGFGERERDFFVSSLSSVFYNNNTPPTKKLHTHQIINNATTKKKRARSLSPLSLSHLLIFFSSFFFRFFS